MIDLSGMKVWLTTQPDKELWLAENLAYEWIEETKLNNKQNYL